MSNKSYTGSIVDLDKNLIDMVSGGMRLAPYNSNINVGNAYPGHIYGPGPYNGGYITQDQWDHWRPQN